ncbi:MAG: amidase [Gemmatimonadota bacterium]
MTRHTYDFRLNTMNSTHASRSMHSDSFPRPEGRLLRRVAAVFLAVLLSVSVLPAAARAQVDVVELTVTEIQEGLRSGAFTAEDLTRASIARIAQYESHYNAFISMNPDAIAIAQALDVEYAGTGPRGPLHGVPVVIKDNIDYGGLVTTAGFDGFSSEAGGVDMIPERDATVAARLRAAGAVILGKTNLPDFAGHGTRTESSVEGMTLNPYNVDKVPGGSSGGTATAVNASFAVLGLGTETGGSIENPASAQGLVGVKGTYGLTPIDGIVPLSGTYVDVVGPLARTVRDAAIALDVLAGPTPEDLATYAAVGHLPVAGYEAALVPGAVQGKRFGLVGTGWRDDFLPLHSDTEAQYRDAIAVLERLGGTAVEDPFAGSGFKELYEERSGVPSQSAHDMHHYFKRLGSGAPFDSVEEWEALSGRTLNRVRRDGELAPPARPSATEEGDAYQAWRHEVRALFRQVLEDHDLDALFFPQSGEPNRPVVEDPERPDYKPNNWAELPSNIINDLGVPVVTVPFGFYEDGTPFVLALIGDTWTEAELLSFAYTLEQETLARRAPELVSVPRAP